MVSEAANLITLFLCGDVMTGRGIDQILPHPGNPILYEPFMRNAGGYVQLAEELNGPIPHPVDFFYLWGDALDELERREPDLRIINLETSVTTSEDYRPDKDIHYRMHPDNVLCLTAAKINCCALANNHLLDWGYSGLVETLETLRKVNIKSAGAGLNLDEAEAPAIMEVGARGRVVMFSFGSPTSGLPLNWAASEGRPGVNLLRDFSDGTVQAISDKIKRVKQEGDVVIISIHWGGNWGYEIPPEHIVFAHRLIDEAGVDLIHGHSSHHVIGLEVYKDKLILYGCGDFLNDYEGIPGYESFRSDLSLMYFPRVNPSTGKLFSLHLTPTRIKNFRVNRASRKDALWLRDTLNREGKRFGTKVEIGRGVETGEDNTLTLGL